MCAWRAPVGSQKQHLNRVTKLFNHQAEKSKPKRGGKNGVRTSYLVSSFFILPVLSLKISFSPIGRGQSRSPERAACRTVRRSLPTTQQTQWSWGALTFKRQVSDSLCLSQTVIVQLALSWEMIYHQFWSILSIPIFCLIMDEVHLCVQ